MTADWSQKFKEPISLPKGRQRGMFAAVKIFNRVTRYLSPVSQVAQFNTIHISEWSFYPMFRAQSIYRQHR
jgi:hypothetical protein